MNRSHHSWNGCYIRPGYHRKIHRERKAKLDLFTAWKGVASPACKLWCETDWHLRLICPQWRETDKWSCRARRIRIRKGNLLSFHEARAFSRISVFPKNWPVDRLRDWSIYCDRCAEKGPGRDKTKVPRVTWAAKPVISPSFLLTLLKHIPGCTSYSTSSRYGY